MVGHGKKCRFISEAREWRRGVRKHTYYGFYMKERVRQGKQV
jgi:hypothetical protein